MRNKRILICFLAVACALALAGCGRSSKVKVSTVELDKKGGVTETVIEDFPSDKYDAEEFAAYVDDAVDAYSEDGEGSVKVSKNEVEAGVITLVMDYDSAGTYAAFNNVECFSGTVGEALAAGYDFSAEFFTAGEYDSDDELSAGAGEQPAVSGSMVTADSDLSVFIVRTADCVKVPGTVQYYCVDAGTASVTDKDTVTVSADPEGDAAGSLVYVVY